MNFREYQAWAATTAVYEDPGYPFLALAEETGEFLGITAKVYRGDDIVARYGSIEAAKQAALKEAGDILWQLSQCLEELGLNLQDAAELNRQKIEDRKARGVLKGAGDDR